MIDHVHSRALSILATADEALATALDGCDRSSLCPGRTSATTMLELGRALLDHQVPRDVALAFARGLASIAQAQVEHFPETVFWDIDYLAARLLAREDAAKIHRVAEEVVALQAEFGRHSELAFRYVHDFTYGFDWARWCRRGDGRPDQGPFSDEFIGYLRRRGHELRELISTDDTKYHKLPPGQPRNPFSFSREPQQERQLHEELARRDLIPVACWDLRAEPRCDRDYRGLRKACSVELHLTVGGVL